MADKKIKNAVVCNLIDLQDDIGLVDGFPMLCAIISDDEEEIAFVKSHFFHEKDMPVVFAPDFADDWCEMGFQAGFFSSKGQARKNNFSGKIPEGWHQVASGKGMNQRFLFLFKGK